MSTHVSSREDAKRTAEGREAVTRVGQNGSKSCSVYVTAAGGGGRSGGPDIYLDVGVRAALRPDVP